MYKKTCLFGIIKEKVKEELKSSTILINKEGEVLNFFPIETFQKK